MSDDDVVWKATGVASAIVAGMLTKRVLDAGWTRLTGRRPPANPAAPGTTWAEALAWAAASGVMIGVMRMVAERGAASAWKAATGSYPQPVLAVSPPQTA